MRKFLIGCVALFAVALSTVAVWAASVDQDEYLRPYSKYNRSDGLYMRTDTGGFDMFLNGYRLQSVGSKAIYEDFTEYQNGDMTCMQTDWTACSATSTEINLLTFPSGNTVAANIIQNTTANVDMDAGYLDIAMDSTDGEGVELVWFMHGADGKPFEVGEDPAFYSCVKFNMADGTATTDDFRIGFRGVEPFQAAWEDYQEAATLGIDTTNIEISTLTGSATTTTDTTENAVDATTYTFCVYVSAAGVVTYSKNGIVPVTVAAYTFVDSTEIVPFLYFLQHTNATGEVKLYEWEVGYQQ